MSAAKILVVDDEVGIRELLRRSCTRRATKCASRTTPARRARCAPAREPDLVLLDIWMPDTDGISLLREWATPTC